MRHGYPPLGLRANSRVSSNVLSSCCFGGLLSIPWCMAVTRCSASSSEQALTSSASTCSTLHLGMFQDWILRALWLYVDFDLLDTGRKTKSHIRKESLSRFRRMTSDRRRSLAIKRLRASDVCATTRSAARVKRYCGSKQLKPGTSCLRHGCVSPPQRSTSRARGRRLLETRCWRQAAVVHGCAQNASHCN